MENKVSQCGVYVCVCVCCVRTREREREREKERVREREIARSGRNETDIKETRKGSREREKRGRRCVVERSEEEEREIERDRAREKDEERERRGQPPLLRGLTRTPAISRPIKSRRGLRLLSLFYLFSLYFTLIG